MPRSGKEARRRLREATLEMFLERGYDDTTTAAIASRAGVTERTFFRHFADKREALFDGEEEFRDLLRQAVVDAPRELAALPALLDAFRSLAPVLEANRPFTAPRQMLIARTPALQERVLAKASRLAEAIGAALVGRGVDRAAARLAAQVGMAVYAAAVEAWLTSDVARLAEHLEHGFAELVSLAAKLRHSPATTPLQPVVT